MGPVTTEYEVGAREAANAPDGWSGAEREQSGVHRPDALLQVGEATWVVEVERTAKRRDSTGTSRYTRIAQLVARGGVVLGRRPIEAAGVWYLAQSTMREAEVVSSILRGLFDGIDSLDHDLLMVVQPWDIDGVAAQPARVRHEAVREAVTAVRPVLVALSDRDRWTPPSRAGFWYLEPTEFERSPARLDDIAVAVVGELTQPVLGGRSVVRSGVRHIPLAGLPTELASPLNQGDRLVAVGTLDGEGCLHALRGRGAGGDWTGRTQPDERDPFTDFDEEALF